MLGFLLKIWWNMNNYMTLEQNYYDTFPFVDNWKAATCFLKVYNFVYKVGDFPEKQEYDR